MLKLATKYQLQKLNGNWSFIAQVVSDMSLENRFFFGEGGGASSEESNKSAQLPRLDRNLKAQLLLTLCLAMNLQLL